MNRSKSKKKTHQPVVEYEIGYCKPPKHARFTKGISGNPGGRRKKPVTMRDTLREQLGESIEVLLGGQKIVMTKLEAATRRLVDKAIAGDMSAFRVLAVLAEVLNESPSASASELEELDHKVLASLFKNYAPGSAE